MISESAARGCRPCPIALPGLSLQVSAQGRARQPRKAPAAETAAWKSQIVQWRAHLGLQGARLPEPPAIRGMVWNERKRALVQMVSAEKMQGVRRPWKKKSLRARLKGVICDVSQSPAYRRFTNKEGCLGTLCTGAELVHLGQRRVLLPEEHLFLQGHNRHQLVMPAGASARQTAKLAGDGFALPCMGLIVWALEATKSFPRCGGTA